MRKEEFSAQTTASVAPYSRRPVWATVPPRSGPSPGKAAADTEDRHASFEHALGRAIGVDREGTEKATIAAGFLASIFSVLMEWGLISGRCRLHARDGR